MSQAVDLDIETDPLDEEEMFAKFVRDTTLFLGPDPEIMTNHDLAPRTELEERAIKAAPDAAILSIVRDRLRAGANEGFEMLEGMGAAPGAKWGDLVIGIFTGCGDLAMCSTGGVSVFSSLVHHPIKFIMKYWRTEPTVGIHPGDCFMHNDARYGNVHNTDQSMLLPVFHDGEVIAWAGATVHEGENGAIEPGGMPSTAESPFDEGLKISPIKIAENYQLRKDLVTFLQNSVREPKLQYEDMKVKMYVCRRVEQRINEAIADFGADTVIAALRQGLEGTRDEVRRRLSEWPDGTVRVSSFADGTLRENVMIKVNLELRKKGDKLTFDFRGSSPEFTNRANNSLLVSVKGLLSQLFQAFIWPDLPRSQGIIAPIEVLVDEASVLNSSYNSPNAQSMMSLFPAFNAAFVATQKLMFSLPDKYTKPLAPWYNMINTFLFGGRTQHGEVVGNVCADINGMGGGAHADSDGEHAVAPLFATMADTGEQELIEEELPFIQIVSKKLLRDNQGFGKYRGGMGYEVVIAMKDSTLWGFMMTCIGSKTPNAYGLFGGYASPTYPLCKVRGIDIFDILKSDPASFRYSMVEIMNRQPFPTASYSSHHMGLKYEPTNRGELYMMSQGSGGGYGDVLERDPALIMTDLEERLNSHEIAESLYKVVYDRDTLMVDPEATRKARDKERRARLRRGKPFKAFMKTWTTPMPPAKLPYYGCWNDPSVIYAGSPDAVMTRDTMVGVMLPNPKDVQIVALEQEVARLKKRCRRMGKG